MCPLPPPRMLISTTTSGEENVQWSIAIEEEDSSLAITTIKCVITAQQSGRTLQLAATKQKEGKEETKSGLDSEDFYRDHYSSKSVSL